MNIDGETNLKLRKIPTELNSILSGSSPEEIQSNINKHDICIRCEQPNSHIYQFTGKYGNNAASTQFKSE